MVNFVIYEDNKKLTEMYADIVRQAMCQYDHLYHIYKYSKYSPDLVETMSKHDGYNVYILDIEVPGKSGLDLAREIRNSNDVDSQLIVVTAHKELLENTFSNRSLVLNFISKFDNCEENLLSAIRQAYLNASKHKSFPFKTEGLTCTIPYQDILFFEMDNETGLVSMYTANDSYTIRKPIVQIFKELDDPRFMKTHKSCIVNVQNIREVDFVNRIIYFKGKKNTDLFSRNYKKELLSRMIKK